MEINCDLHCHSGFAGGVGNISLDDIDRTMPLKGIDIIGTGDALQKNWVDSLQADLREESHGIFSTGPEKSVRYVLQSEIIITSPIRQGRKSVHHVFLFPSFDSIGKCRALMESWGVKLAIGRPFLKCRDKADVCNKLRKIHGIDPLIESFPAHVMTPDGIYGSNNPIIHMREFYGEAVESISAVETGLSADPVVLSQIPELDRYTLLSNSDAHSAQLHRMGREFTTLEIRKLDFSEIIRAIRNNKVSHTAEFNPTEGRYFLTGHRKGKKGHGDRYCVYSPRHTPRDKKCPICKKNLTIGVLERSQILKMEQGGEDREWGYRPRNTPDFVHMVPLIEIIGYTLGVRTPTSKRVVSKYHDVVRHLGNECAMWFMKESDILKRLEGNVEETLLRNILKIKRGEFTFVPMGYDGTYGNLRIGEESDIFDIKEIRMDDSQVTLDMW